MTLKDVVGRLRKTTENYGSDIRCSNRNRTLRIIRAAADEQVLGGAHDAYFSFRFFILHSKKFNTGALIKLAYFCFLLYKISGP